MENNLKNLLDAVDLKRYLPRGYGRMISEKIMEANRNRPEEEQLAASPFTISKVIRERRYEHPIFPFIMEVVIEKREKEKGFREKFHANIDQFVSIINE